MPKQYQPVPPVICEHCGVSFSRRRPSKTGVYYCGKQECQAERQRQYMLDLRRERRNLSDSERKTIEDNGAAFVWAALWAPRVQCPECGLLNGLRGYAHFDSAGRGCGGLGGRVLGISAAHAAAVWPEDKREYEVL